MVAVNVQTYRSTEVHEMLLMLSGMLMLLCPGRFSVGLERHLCAEYITLLHLDGIETSPHADRACHKVRHCGLWPG